MKAIFTAKLGSGYDDLPERRYHFPSTYLAQVKNAVGDEIIYYEPRRKFSDALGGRQSYFAIARVSGIERDPRNEKLFYANITDYLDFDRPVPFRADGRYFESKLMRDDGDTNKGAFGRSVRNVSDEEFDTILQLGLPTSLRDQEPEPLKENAGFDEPPADFKHPVVQLTGSRLFRDRAFSRHVQDAYDRTCSITGMRIINGGGRPEAQAAHIQPITADGPDSVRNGLSLSGTLHWMFDRGLVSADEEYRILFADSGVPPAIRKLANPTGKLVLPSEPRSWPHQHFLSFHRENVFKG